jgi:hypothetical protein
VPGQMSSAQESFDDPRVEVRGIEPPVSCSRSRRDTTSLHLEKLRRTGRCRTVDVPHMKRSLTLLGAKAWSPGLSPSFALASSPRSPSARPRPRKIGAAPWALTMTPIEKGDAPPGFRLDRAALWRARGVTVSQVARESNPAARFWRPSRAPALRDLRKRSERMGRAHQSSQRWRDTVRELPTCARPLASLEGLAPSAS